MGEKLSGAAATQLLEQGSPSSVAEGVANRYGREAARHRRNLNS
jgi:hypothetical protein